MALPPDRQGNTTKGRPSSSPSSSPPNVVQTTQENSDRSVQQCEFAHLLKEYVVIMLWNLMDGQTLIRMSLTLFRFFVYAEIMSKQTSSKLPAVLSATEDDIQLLLSAQCHVGSKNCDKQMEPYVWKRRQDGMFT